MNEIKNTALIVKKVLTEDEATRNSDMLLYVKVCQILNPSVATLPFFYVLGNLKALNLPCIETVRRTRQKIQAEYPELAGSPKIKAARKELQDDYLKFAREGV